MEATVQILQEISARATRSSGYNTLIATANRYNTIAKTASSTIQIYSITGSSGTTEYNLTDGSLLDITGEEISANTIYGLYIEAVDADLTVSSGTTGSTISFPIFSQLTESMQVRSGSAVLWSSTAGELLVDTNPAILKIAAAGSYNLIAIVDTVA